jgi:phosphatidate cytidylyltransferase
MKELGTRALTGAVYVALTLGAAAVGPVTTALLFLPVCVLGMREMHLLYWEREGPPLGWSMVMGAIMHSALAAGILLPGWHIGHAFAVGTILVLASITWLLLKGDEAPAHSFGGVLTLLLLVAIPFGLLPAFFGFGRWVFAAFMVLLWTNDTGAYLVGRTIGRTKLLPAVSPKKTVEGLIGGVVLTIGVGWFIAGQQPMLSRTEWIVLAAIVSITATLGDLLESAFKRARRVKDSGTVMPGHGGILDRFDGFFLAVPSVMLYLYLIR